MSVTNNSRDSNDVSNDNIGSSNSIETESSLISHPITKTENSEYKRFSNFRSVGETIRTVKSTIAFFSNKINEERWAAEKDREARNHNKTSEIPIDVKVKSSVSSLQSEDSKLETSKCVIEEKIVNTESNFLNTNENNVFQISRKSVEPINTSEINVNKSTVTSLDESNIWPVLMDLEKNFTSDDENRENKNREILKKLNENFTKSPKRFTETLLTTIEESFLKNLKNEESKVDSSASSIPSKSGNIDESTISASIDQRPKNRVKSFDKNLINRKNYRQSPKSLSTRETNRTISKRRRSREMNSTGRVAGGVDKNNISMIIPPIVGKRDAPKLTIAHRLRIGSNASNDEKSPRKSQMKPPDIIIHCATPKPREKPNRELVTPRKKSEDEEYFTAESNSGGSNRSGHRVESSIISTNQRNDLNKVALTYKQFPPLDPNENDFVSHFLMNFGSQVSTLKPRHGSSSSAVRKKRPLSKGNESKDCWQKELQQKRQKCFNVVDKLLSEKDGKAVPAEEAESTTSGIESKPTIEFLDILQACSDYLAYGTKLEKTHKSSAKSGKFFSNSSSNLASEENNFPSSSRCPIKKLPSMLDEKRLGTKTPSKRYLSPTLKTSPRRSKRRSLSVPDTSGVDITATRSVNELRKIFSPSKRAALGSPKSSAKVNRTPRTVNKNSKLQISGTSCDVDTKIATAKKSKKFEHVKSRVGEYINGKK